MTRANERTHGAHYSSFQFENCQNSWGQNHKASINAILSWASYCLASEQKQLYLWTDFTKIYWILEWSKKIEVLYKIRKYYIQFRYYPYSLGIILIIIIETRLWGKKSMNDR